MSATDQSQQARVDAAVAGPRKGGEVGLLVGRRELEMLMDLCPR
jgi:hypothetical protein